ncbi:MAG: type II toxin-antitoxin system HicB family antitoxin [Minisyncoccia bacterium]
MPKNLKGLVWKEGKWYVSQCLNVNVASQGRTRREALDNLRDALALYFEDKIPASEVSKIERPEIVSVPMHV